jgi:hypothetical protein
MGTKQIRNMLGRIEPTEIFSVIPAQAGIHLQISPISLTGRWILAYAE